MGLFLQLGGFLASESDVSQAVEVLRDTYPASLTKLRWHNPNPNRVVTLMEEDAGDAAEAIQAISSTLQCPAFWFHIHDEDLWMYTFFRSGVETDCFNTIPGYWEDLSEQGRQQWRGNAKAICAAWPGVKEEDIERYLVDHSLDDFEGDAKAYATDAFQAWNCWQLVDFMAKLGLKYPDRWE